MSDRVKRKVRANIRGRGVHSICISKTSRHFRAQICDPAGVVLGGTSTLNKSVSKGLKTTGNIEAAKKVGTEVAKLNKQIKEISSKLDEANQNIAEKDVQLAESARKARIEADKAERKNIMNEMMSPLSKQQREIMNALLESVKTDKLQSAFNKYLPSVLKEDAKKPEKKVKSKTLFAMLIEMEGHIPQSSLSNQSSLLLKVKQL